MTKHIKNTIAALCAITAIGSTFVFAACGNTPSEPAEGDGPNTGGPQQPAPAVVVAEGTNSDTAKQDYAAYFLFKEYSDGSATLSVALQANAAAKTDAELLFKGTLAKTVDSVTYTVNVNDYHAYQTAEHTADVASKFVIGTEEKYKTMTSTVADDDYTLTVNVYADGAEYSADIAVTSVESETDYATWRSEYIYRPNAAPASDIAEGSAFIDVQQPGSKLKTRYTVTYTFDGTEATITYNAGTGASAIKYIYKGTVSENGGVFTFHNDVAKYDCLMGGNSLKNSSNAMQQNLYNVGKTNVPTVTYSDATVNGYKVTVVTNMQTAMTFEIDVAKVDSLEK